MDRCEHCLKYISIMETNVGKNDEDLCNDCFAKQRDEAKVTREYRVTKNGKSYCTFGDIIYPYFTADND